MVNFLKGVCDPYICEHSFFLLGSTPCLMMEFPAAAAYFQENENVAPQIFFSVFWIYTPSYAVSRRFPTVKHTCILSSKVFVGGMNPDYGF